MRREIRLGLHSFTVTACRTADAQHQVYQTQIDTHPVLTAQLQHLHDVDHQLIIDGKKNPLKLVRYDEKVFIQAFGRNFELTIINPVEQQADSKTFANLIKAPMPGIVLEVHVKPGQKVIEGQPLIAIESMKIMTEFKAWRNGIIKTINYDSGDSFEKNAVLITMEPAEQDPEAVQSCVE